jgi:hypothetical protein
MKFQENDFVEIKTLFSNPVFNGGRGHVKVGLFTQRNERISYTQYLVDFEYSPFDFNDSQFWFFEEELKKVEKSS